MPFSFVPAFTAFPASSETERRCEHFQFICARSFANALDDVAVAIAGGKFHFRISPLDLRPAEFDEADAFKEFAPVSVDKRRMLVMMLPTVTCVAA